MMTSSQCPTVLLMLVFAPDRIFRPRCSVSLWGEICLYSQYCFMFQCHQFFVYMIVNELMSSPGQPKGVVITHRALVSAVAGMVRTFCHVPASSHRL